ncbi:homeodomain-like protein [Tanacetum coccineum]
MEEYMTKTREDYGLSIVGPKINEKAHFELKCQFLKELRDNTFSGSDNKDANKHIEKGLEIVDLFHIPDVTQAAIQAHLNNLRREIKKVNEKVYAAQVGCESCSGLHYTKDCPLNKVGKILEKAYDTQFGVIFPQGGRYRAASLGFYQRDNGNSSKESANNLKWLLMEKLRMGYQIKVSTNMHDSSILEDSLPPKEKDSGSLGELTPTKLIIILADRMMKHPKGIAENVLVGIDKFVFPVDFVVLDMPEDIKVPLILGRPFLSTAHAKIDVFKRKITLRVGDDKIVFKNKIEYKGKDVVGDFINVPIFVGSFSVVIDFVVVENIGAYRDHDIGEVIVGRPFCREIYVKARRFYGMITIYNGNDSVSARDKLNGISHPYQKLKSFYKGVLNLELEYIRDAMIEEFLTRGHVVDTAYPNPMDTAY